MRGQRRRWGQRRKEEHGKRKEKRSGWGALVIGRGTPAKRRRNERLCGGNEH